MRMIPNGSRKPKQFLNKQAPTISRQRAKPKATTQTPINQWTGGAHSSPEKKELHMSKAEMRKATGFLLVGAAVGAGVALLYAPQSGNETKKDIRRFARKTVNGLDELQTGIRD